VLGGLCQQAHPFFPSSPAGTGPSPGGGRHGHPKVKSTHAAATNPQDSDRAVGVGLHSGQRVELTLRPAQPDTGIVFRRVDLPIPVDIPVSAQAVTDTRMASTISNGGAKVHTVEHLMSACAGLGLDNLYVDITGEEVPILDGSSAFVRVPAAKRGGRIAEGAAPVRPGAPAG